MIARSYLFVPGHKENMLPKSLGSGADAVVWDLEDGVPAAEKETARETVGRCLASAKPSGPAIWVRINAFSTGSLDLDLETLRPNLAGIMLPKAESADEVRFLAKRISLFEEKKNLRPGSVKVHAILETALGVWRAAEIALASDRVDGISLGAEDFTLDVGTSRSREGIELAYARGRIVLAAAVARVQAVDTVFSDLNDTEGLDQESRLGRQLGFRGKFAIHPKQVPAINTAYSPSEKEILFARKVVAAFAEAQKNNIGVITVDGKMIDPPVAERSRQLLEGLNEE